MRDCYTGFKWIAHEIALTEGQKNYIAAEKRAMDSLQKTLCATKMPLVHVRCWQKYARMLRIKAKLSTIC